MLKLERETVVLSDHTDDTLGGRLSTARDAAGMSVEALASQLGVGADMVIGWESDRAEPQAVSLIEMAGILGVSPMWLMTGAGEGPDDVSDERLLEAIKIELARLRSAHQDMGRLIESTTRQLEKLDHQLRLRSLSKDVAH